MRSRFVCYLGVEGGQKDEPQYLLDRVRPSGSSRSGDVDLFWAIAQDLPIPQTIDRICRHRSSPGNPSPGILLTVWASHRVVHPESATQLERWTPTTDLPRLTPVPPEAFTKDAFLFALDKVCGEDPPTGRPSTAPMPSRRSSTATGGRHTPFPPGCARPWPTT